MKKRIWELDAFRGLCILGMVIVHLVYDMVDMYRLVDWEYPLAFTLVLDYGGKLFFILSGLCATLGSRSVRRGITVLAGGVLCTAVTGGMYLLGLASDPIIIIWFGALHCLGVCMLLWPLFKKLPVWALILLGAAALGAGWYLDAFVRADFPWLVPLGVVFPGFRTSDYFPLLPNLGFFLLGAAIGRVLYRKKESLLPGVNARLFPISFLCWCGRQALPIYLLHQPILTGLLALVSMLK